MSHPTRAGQHGRTRRRTRATAVAGAFLAVASGVVALNTAATPRAGAAATPQPTITKWNGINPVTTLTKDTFASPPSNDKPWVRWNWPATTTVPQLMTDLDQLADRGIAGVEIGQGSNPSNDQLTAILKRANELGITVGVKYSGGAPVTGTWDSTNNYTRKTLTNSRTVVDAGANFTGALPGTGTIVAVVAYRCTNTPCEASGARTLDRTSAINLTSQITDKNTDGFFGGSTAGSLNWTAPASPAGAQWVLATFRSTVFQNAPETLTKQGTEAMIAGYESLWTPEIKELVKENHSDIFVDSHPTDPWGTPTELWSSTMATDFQNAAGYSIVPDLAALFYSDFKYGDGRDERVRTDFYQVRNDLFINNRIKPFTRWANGHGMTLRLQPEDPNIGGADAPYQDEIDMGYNLQRPEHESLVGDQIDIWRPIASANSWTGNPWYSEECCAVGSENYVETLQDVQERMNKSFAAGITKLVYHVYDTSYSTTSTFPGYANFGPTSFSGAWGPRNPNWDTDGLAVNTWVARNQQVLTQGRSDVDVAVYLHSFEWPAGALVNTDGSPFKNRFWDDQTMQRAGYTWDYVNPTLLNSSDATVSDGILNAAGPSYKALVIDTGINTPNHPRKYSMSVKTAARMLELAQDGLKIILVGDAPSETEGDAGNDAKLKAVIADLLAQPNVYRVASEAGVPAKLAALGVSPDAQPSQRSTLFSRHLKDPASSTDYYYLYNQGKEVLDWASRDTVYEEPEACRYTGTLTPCRKTGEPISLDVTLKGHGVPYLLNTHSGTITPITEYLTTAAGVKVHVNLDADDSTIVALSTDPARFGVRAPSAHVVSTTADSAEIASNGRVVLHDTRPGTYTATLSDGRTVTARIDNVPAAVDLTDATWKLSVEDWKNANPIGTTGEDGSAISKSQADLTLDGLKAWPDIPELANSSGVGTYTTTVTLPDTWRAGTPAVLSLGQVVDTFSLTVNGTHVPINQLSAKADIGAFLNPGANAIEVRVATTLNNMLSKALPAVATRGVIQEYGIVGPVTLTPAGEASATNAPAAITAPAITGTVKVGASVRCTPGTWVGATSYTYGWAVGGSGVAGANRDTLALTPAMVGKLVTCVVTAAGEGGTTTRTSAGVRVAKGDALRVTVRPKVTGARRVGRTLRVNPGRWTPSATAYTFQWKRNGNLIRGAHQATYRLKATDKGKRISVTVAAVNPAYANGISTTAAGRIR